MLDIDNPGEQATLLAEAVRNIKDIDGMTVEIGVRCGGASYLIMKTCLENNDVRMHIGVDPYGALIYVCGDDSKKWGYSDYTNKMKNMAMKELYEWCSKTDYPFTFICLEDTEFFNRYADGIPIYNLAKFVLTKYALVFYDGPHEKNAVMKEIEFFSTRTPIGGIWVFDDTDYYDHKFVTQRIIDYGFVVDKLAVTRKISDAEVPNIIIYKKIK